MSEYGLPRSIVVSSLFGRGFLVGLGANNGSHRSIVFLNLRTQRSLTFVSGFPGAF